MRAYWLVVAGQATGVIARLREPSTYVTTRAAESNDRTPSPPDPTFPLRDEPMIVKREGEQDQSGLMKFRLVNIHYSNRF